MATYPGHSLSLAMGDDSVMVRQALRRFLDWLDSRFPEVVKVDLKLYMAMKEDIKTLAMALDLANARIDSIIKKQELMEKQSSYPQTGR